MRREVCQRRERLQARALIAQAETAAHSGEIAVALRVRGSGLGTSWRRKIQTTSVANRRATAAAAPRPG